MAFDPVTAVIDAGKTVLNKFVADKMSEAEAAQISNDFTLEMLKETRKEGSAFRDFVLQYEGAAKDVPRLVQIFRAIIRPGFTCLVGYLDWHFFTGSGAFTPEQTGLLKAINIIVLMFWFGERAVVNSGLLDKLKDYAASKENKR